MVIEDIVYVHVYTLSNIYSALKLFAFDLHLTYQIYMGDKETSRLTFRLEKVSDRSLADGQFFCHGFLLLLTRLFSVAAWHQSLFVHRR